MGIDKVSSLIAKSLIWATGPRVLEQFRKRCASPLEMQKNLLDHIIQKNQTAQFGKDHSFKHIRSVRDYQRTVPINTYEDLKPYIERAFRGEPAQLTLETPIFFAMTSGTTGLPKYIPVTPESDAAKAELMRVWSTKILLDHPNIFSGKALTIVSPAVERYTSAGIPCGSESGHGYCQMPDKIKEFYALPYGVFEIEDYETKYYLFLRIAAAQKINVIYTCNPSTIFLLGQRLSQFSESIIRDVHDGTIASRFKISYDLALSLKNYIKPDPARAKILEAAAGKAGGKLLAKDVWPEMSVIACWKGGSVSLYLPKFSRYFRRNIPVRDIGYFSSEFRGSIPLSDHDSTGVLTIPANFYEFFPAEENRIPKGGELLTLDQIEIGKKYFVYVTTLSGLYRYDMNDIIEVAGFYEKTPLIRFIQKGNGMVSFTGEKLCESQVMEAVHKVFGDFQGHYEFIAAVGELVNDTPRYAFLFEFEKPVETDYLRDLTERIEQALCESNLEYAVKRRSKRIQSPVLRVIKHGEYDLFRKRAIQVRNNDGQFKILKLTSDESFSKNFEIEREVSSAA